MHYPTLSQACDCHGIFVGEVIIIVSVKIDNVDVINVHLTGFMLNLLETVLKLSEFLCSVAGP